MKNNKKDDESNSNPFANLDKTSVLQEARAFNETPINVRKCNAIMTKVEYLIMQGENLSRTEATDLFFAVTKLWQCKDTNLRRQVYLVVKELSNEANDVIIVTSSLTKDMIGRDEIYRAPAVRALCRIIDTGMVQTIERYMKQAIVDKNSAVASAALVSSSHLMTKSADVVRRWANEVQEAISADNNMVQYHALGLLYQIRCNDRLATNKLVQKFSKPGVLRSPFALCYLIRIAAKLLEEDDQADSNLFSFIETCLRHKSEMVVFEAARAIVGLRNTTPSELAPAISVLQVFCSSPKPALRFAAVKTLSKVSIKHPQAVMTCNVDLEKLIVDPNRSIATLAITTLLKTGSESSVEHLMKQISSFVNEISDEFKIVVVDAIRSLCARYPRKHTVMMPFLSSMIKPEAALEYKRAIVETIIAIVQENEDAKKSGLAQLCEFIEDCEHPSLSVKVLHFLGNEAPKTANPSSYIRFIYNRVILETASVRAAAVTALAKFGAQCEDLRPSVIVLLKRCLLDTDDEVRDRATLYLYLLSNTTPAMSKHLLLDDFSASPSALESALINYLRSDDFSTPFDIRIVPVTSQMKAPVLVADVDEPKPKQAAKQAREEPFAEHLAAIPEFASLGPIFRTVGPIALTDSVSEYVVNAYKHVFPNHIVVQFDCKNTIDDMLLENVVIELDDAEKEWAPMRSIPIDSLPCNQVKRAYVLYAFPESGSVSGSISCTMKFNVKDVDPSTGLPDSDDTYEDSYPLEDLEIAIGDSVMPLPKQTFAASWEALEDSQEFEETFQLSSVSSLADALKKVADMLGLAPCERSDRVPDGRSQHTALLSGVFRGGHEVFARATVAIDPSDRSINLNIVVRSAEPIVAELLASAIA